MKAIVAVDKNWGIGKNGKLLTRIKDDMKHFKDYTMGKTIVMGRNTFSEINKPLPGRKNVVISSTLDPKLYSQYDNMVIVNPDNLNMPVKDYIIETFGDDIIITGGSKVYSLFRDVISSYMVTKIDYDFGANVFIDDLDKLMFDHEVIKSDFDKNTGLNYSIVQYTKKSF